MCERKRKKEKNSVEFFSGIFSIFKTGSAGRAGPRRGMGRRGSRLSTATRMIEGRQQMKVIEQAKVIEHSPDALIGKPKGLLRRI
jgi:hypothetical protein